MKNRKAKFTILRNGLTLTLIIFFLPFGKEVEAQGNIVSSAYFFQEILKVKSFWKIVVIGISLCTPLILSLEITQKEKLHFENFPQKIFALIQLKLFIYGIYLVFAELIPLSMYKIHGRFTIIFLIYFLSAIIGIGWIFGQLFKNHSWWED